MSHVKEEHKVSDTKALECPVCYEEGILITPECGHGICYHCLGKMIVKSCPLCRTKYSSAFLNDNRIDSTLSNDMLCDYEDDHFEEFVHMYIDDIIRPSVNYANVEENNDTMPELVHPSQLIHGDDGNIREMSRLVHVYSFTSFTEQILNNGLVGNLIEMLRPMSNPIPHVNSSQNEDDSLILRPLYSGMEHNIFTSGFHTRFN